MYTHEKFKVAVTFIWSYCCCEWGGTFLARILIEPGCNAVSMLQELFLFQRIFDRNILVKVIDTFGAN